MKPLAMIGWGLLALLVVISIGLVFSIDLFLGTAFLVFCLGVGYWVFFVKKRATDRLIAKAASDLGLVFKPHPLRYGAMAGDFKGLPVRISYEGTSGGGAGLVIVATGGSPGYAALDVRNETVVRLTHPLSQEQQKAISRNDPTLRVDARGVADAIDGICTSARTLKRKLGQLASEIKGVKD